MTDDERQWPRRARFELAIAWMLVIAGMAPGIGLVVLVLYRWLA